MTKLKIFSSLFLLITTLTAIKILKNDSAQSTEILKIDFTKKSVIKPVEIQNLSEMSFKKHLGQNFVPEGLTRADYERENLMASDAEIRNKIAEIQRKINSENLIEKANAGQLSLVEYKELRDSIRLKSVLHKLLIDRELKSLGEKI